MKFENTEVWGFEHALRGMRNPLESWDRSDSNFPIIQTVDDLWNGIGEKDLRLAQQLIRAGNEHRKFMRQIFVSVDITAPIYWWKEFDTYKVGTVANSTSTMHKLASTPITFDCFERDDFETYFTSDLVWNKIIECCEWLRQRYNETKDKRYWKELIRILPESWLQKRTVTMDYENVLSIIHQRKSHKFTEWSVDFIKWAKTLPYAEQLLFLESK